MTGTSIFVAVLFQIICVGITILFGNFLLDLFQVDKICLTYLYKSKLKYYQRHNASVF